MDVSSETIQAVLLAITIIGGSILYARNRIPQQNVQNLTALVSTYEKRIKAMEDELKDSHNLQLQNVSAIADLQGQVKVYKELPLRELADGINEVVKISKENAVSNQHILETLQRSAAALSTEKRDGGLLVKTKDGTPLEVKV
jgi:hypothetical protein